MDVNDYQIGGSHYKGGYQHWDWIIELNMHYLFACATKYIIRWKDKNGIEDLRKAVHYLAKADDRCIHFYKYETHQKIMLVNTRYSGFFNSIGEQEREIILAILQDNIIIAQHLLSVLISEAELGIEADSAYTNQG